MKRSFLLAAAACAWASQQSMAGQVWQSTFDATADGVVDLRDNNTAKAMIGAVADGRLQINQMDNGTSAYTPDKAGRPLDATKVAADSFSSLYEFRWTTLNEAETQAFTLTGFLGDAVPQTRQVLGTIIRHWKAEGNYYVGLDCAVGSVGATDFGYVPGVALGLGTSPQGTDFRLAVSFDGPTHVLDFGLYDTTGTRLTGQVVDLDTDVPGLHNYSTPDVELGALSLTHLGWEDYSGNLLDQPIVSQVDKLTYWDDSAGALAAAAVPAPGGGSTWALDGNGQWSVAANWQGSVPNSAGATANFGTVITSASSVDVDGAFAVGAVNFDSPVSYTLLGTGSLWLDVSSGEAAIDIASGSHIISVPVHLEDNLIVTTAAATSLVLAGDLVADGKMITKAGDGTAQVENLRAAGLSVNAGVAKISAKGAANDSAGTSRLASLSIAAGASVDLTNNSLVLDYTGSSPIDELRQQLLDGRLMSGSADANKKLGYGEASVTGFANGTFAGQSVDADAVLVKFTYGGDSNLDGKVDVGDLGNLASNWQQSAPWTGGDFDYNGTVNVGDLGILATNWQQGVTTPALAPSFSEALAALGLPGASVPEPVSIGLVALAGVVLQRGSRRAS